MSGFTDIRLPHDSRRRIDLGQLFAGTEKSSAETSAENTLPFSQSIDAHTGASPVQALPKIDLPRDETPDGGL